MIENTRNILRNNFVFVGPFFIAFLFAEGEDQLESLKKETEINGRHLWNASIHIFELCAAFIVGNGESRQRHAILRYVIRTSCNGILGLHAKLGAYCTILKYIDCIYCN